MMAKSESAGESNIREKNTISDLSNELSSLEVDNMVGGNNLPEEILSETVTQSNSVVSQDNVNKNKEHNEFESDDELIESYESTDYEDYIEEQYWDENNSLTTKLKSSKSKSTTSKIDYGFNTFRKPNVKLQGERKLDTYYKLDQATLLGLKNHFDFRNCGEYHNVIGTGKNSIVLSIGTTIVKNLDGYYYSFPQKMKEFRNAIKIYRLTDSDTVNRAIFKRVQRECDNLLWLRYHCYLCHHVPCFVSGWRNIIVMQFVGDNGETAPSILYHHPKQSTALYDKITDHMGQWYRMYKGLVHGKLSTKTIRYWQGEPFYIGWQHSVDSLDHPVALKKLIKDCYFITKFFEERGVKVKPVEQLYFEITKLNVISEEVAAVIPRKKLKLKRYRESLLTT